MVPNTGICSGERCPKASAVALHLLGHVAQRVGRALAVELVDGHELGEVEHVDLLELAGGAELGRHHVQRHVHQRHDGGVALADARGLDDDQVEAGGLAGGSTSGRAWLISLPKSRVARLRMNTRGPWPGRDGVHADAVAQQRAAALAPRRVDADHGDAQRSSWSRRRRRISSSVRLLLPAPPVPVMPSTGVSRFAAARRQRGLEGRVGLAVLQRGDGLGQRAPGGLGVALQRGIPSFGACADRSWSQRITISPIMPCRPMRWPSSGL
jgi:hypothetical protein